jgi:hypothetical protein
MTDILTFLCQQAVHVFGWFVTQYYIPYLKFWKKSFQKHFHFNLQPKTDFVVGDSLQEPVCCPLLDLK